MCVAIEASFEIGTSASAFGLKHDPMVDSENQLPSIAINGGVSALRLDSLGGVLETFPTLRTADRPVRPTVLLERSSR